MGKKRVIKTSEAELLKEREKIEQKLKKEISFKVLKETEKGRIYISLSYNNTLITFTDEKGNVLFWRSAGNIGFKGTKKGTPFAASKVAEAVANICNELKIKKVDIFIKGVGSGRTSTLKTFVNQGLEIESITDITPIPHNGCRPAKRRRV